MSESLTVTVGLDVHARSVRLAAVRADKLLEERTLAYDEEAVVRVLGRWPGRALLLWARPDRLRSVPASGRARVLIVLCRARARAPVAWRSGQDRSA